MDGYCGRNQHPRHLFDTNSSLKVIFEHSSGTQDPLAFPQAQDFLHPWHGHHIPELRIRHSTNLSEHVRPRRHFIVSDLGHPHAHSVQRPRHHRISLLWVSERQQTLSPFGYHRIFYTTRQLRSIRLPLLGPDIARQYCSLDSVLRHLWLLLQRLQCDLGRHDERDGKRVCG